MVMKINIFFVCVANLLILFPSIPSLNGGVTDISGNGVAAVDDMVSEESSPDSSKVMVHNTFHLSKMDFEKLPLANVEISEDPPKNLQHKIEDKVADSNQWDTVHNQFNTWTKIVEVKINSLMKSNENVVNMLTELEKNVVRISKACDMQSEKLSKRNNEDEEMMKKLNMVQRHIANSSRMKHPDIIGASQIEIIKKLIDVIGTANNNLEHFSLKELIQVFGNSKKSVQTLEELKNIVHSIDERTTKLLNASGQHQEMISSYKLNEKKLNSFTNCITSSFKEIGNAQIPKFGTTLRKGTTNGWNRMGDNGQLIDIRSIDEEISDTQNSKLWTTQRKGATNGFNNGLPPRMGDNQLIDARVDDKRVSYEPNKYNCHDLQVRRNGIYKFGSLDEFPNDAGRFFYERYCDFNTDGVAWTVIQRRFLNKNQENFNRTWSDYKFGFGKLDSEFWLGNEFIHKLTFDDEMEFRIVLEDSNGREEWAEYALFRVEAEEYNYNLMIGGYRGSIPDSFMYHNDQDFSTYDRQNDNSDTCPCATSFGSGWWYNNCTEANLNGNHDGSRQTSNNRESMGEIYKNDDSTERFVDWRR